MIDPEVKLTPFPGTDDAIVSVKHADGHFIRFRFNARGSGPIWDYSFNYVDAGHNAGADFRLAYGVAADYHRRCCV